MAVRTTPHILHIAEGLKSNTPCEAVSVMSFQAWFFISCTSFPPAHSPPSPSGVLSSFSWEWDLPPAQARRQSFPRKDLRQFAAIYCSARLRSMAYGLLISSGDVIFVYRDLVRTTHTHQPSVYDTACHTWLSTKWRYYWQIILLLFFPVRVKVLEGKRDWWMPKMEVSSMDRS